MNFTINIPYGLKDWPVFFDIFYDEYFTGVELPADYLVNDNLNLLLKKNNLKITNVIDLLESSLLSNVALQEQKVREKIFSRINSIIIEKHEFEIRSFLLDLGFSPALKASEKDTSIIHFLKKFSYSLYHNNSYITIPVNINSDFAPIPYQRYYIDILLQTMFCNFKLSINLLPHELKNSFPVDDMYKSLIYYTKNLRLIYEPDTGNYLTEKLLQFWLEPLEKYCFKGDIIIVPKTTSSFVYESEVKKVTSIIEKIKKKTIRAKPKYKVIGN